MDAQGPYTAAELRLVGQAMGLDLPRLRGWRLRLAATLLAALALVI